MKPPKRQTGFQRTRLLRPATHLPPPPPDVRSLVITNSKVAVPAAETTYWCRVTRLPRHFQQKHHVLQFGAAIQAGSESLVHHIELFHCEAPANEIIPLYEGSCTAEDRPEATRVCKRVIAAWAYGAGPFIYPEVDWFRGRTWIKFIICAGVFLLLFGFRRLACLSAAPSSILTLCWKCIIIIRHFAEVIYSHKIISEAASGVTFSDNTSFHFKGCVDSSGIRMRYTSKLRKHDAGVMELGLEYTDKMVISPE